jgi:hypothetical protein
MDPFTDGLDRAQVTDHGSGEEGGVAFIEMDALDVVDAQGLDRAVAADAEQGLLAQSIVVSSTVQGGRDGSPSLAVGGVRGIEEVDGHLRSIIPNDVTTPDLDVYVFTFEREIEDDACVFEHAFGVTRWKADLLAAAIIDRLDTVTYVVIKRDHDQGDAMIGGRLGVVTGEDAEATAVGW